MIIFQPNKERQTYSKKYLHVDEEEFFISGPDSNGLIGDNADIAVAICYELSVPEHSFKAFKSGAKVYIASVAKHANGVEEAIGKLSEIAGTYSMTVLMSNCVGMSDGYECGGRTSVWDDKGLLVGQLNDTEEGIIIFDMDRKEPIIIAV